MIGFNSHHCGIQIKNIKKNSVEKCWNCLRSVFLFDKNQFVDLHFRSVVCFLYYMILWDALCDFVSIVQFKKRE